MNNNENTKKSKSPKTVTGKMNSDIVIPSFPRRRYASDA